jgi:hypothetical protein
MKRNDFPFVFEEYKKILGGPRLTQALQDRLTARNQSQIYKLIARWPVQGSSVSLNWKVVACHQQFLSDPDLTGIKTAPGTRMLRASASAFTP